MESCSRKPPAIRNLAQASLPLLPHCGMELCNDYGLLRTSCFRKPPAIRNLAQASLPLLPHCGIIYKNRTATFHASMKCHFGFLNLIITKKGIPFFLSYYIYTGKNSDVVGRTDSMRRWVATMWL